MLITISASCYVIQEGRLGLAVHASKKENNMLPNNSVLDTDLDDRTRRSADIIDLSIIVPTRNEVGNINPLLSKISQALAGLHAEVLFVDDSSDGTPQVIEASAQSFPDLNIRLFHRPAQQRRGGLGSAVLLGLQNIKSEYACVMDGDLQHPPELLPKLLHIAHDRNADLVVATRRASDSRVDGLNAARNLISLVLDFTARALFPGRLRGVSDPLSGFFLVRRNALNLTSLQPNGFKILLEILIRNPRLRKAEIPFQFGERLTGESKASTKEALNYLHLLWTLKFGNGSLRLIGFGLVGATGIVVNSLVLYLVTSQMRIYYLLSVAIATVASTLWNFSLIEVLIYRATRQPQGRLRRLMLFSALNIGALLIRGPVIYFLTSVFMINYLISNLVTLIFMVGLRFIASDNVIWGKAFTRATSPANLANPLASSARWSYSYNIHNLVTVVSEGLLPELEPFQVNEVIEKPTIQVSIGIPPSPKAGAKKNPNYLCFHEFFGHGGFEVGIWMGEQVKVIASPLLRLSPHVLYTNVVEPILRWTFVKKGYALVHGATLAFGAEAFLITARTDTGKTTTLLKILSHQRRNSDQAAFMSDDMTIISPDGVALTYPKPLTISAHTLFAIDAKTLNIREKASLPLQSRIHSRTGRKVASFINKTLLPAATINMFLQMVIPPPKYFVHKLIPHVKLAHSARVAGMFIIERGGNGSLPINHKDALEILLSNCEDAYGFPPYNDLKEFLYHYNGVDLRSIEQRIIRQAFGELPATLVKSQNLDWWCLIPHFIDEHMADACSCDNDQALNILPASALRSTSGD
jgi:dolichol-phosphate mannosyltransferase